MEACVSTSMRRVMRVEQKRYLSGVWVSPVNMKLILMIASCDAPVNGRAALAVGLHQLNVSTPTQTSAVEENGNQMQLPINLQGTRRRHIQLRITALPRQAQGQTHLLAGVVLRETSI